MKKTLEQAIGCWTTSYDGSAAKAFAIKQAANWCQKDTIKGLPMKLQEDLIILRKRVETMLEHVKSAEARLLEIIATDELNQEVENG